MSGAEKSAVIGELAERNVYSAIIKNQTSNTIHCFVEYRTLSDTDNEIIEFDIEGNGKEQECEEKVHTISTHTTGSPYSNVFPKSIYSLRAQKSDGSKLKVVAPFDNVPHGNVRNWKFIIDNDQIHSSKN